MADSIRALKEKLKSSGEHVTGKLHNLITSENVSEDKSSPVGSPKRTTAMNVSMSQVKESSPTASSTEPTPTHRRVNSIEALKVSAVASKKKPPGENVYEQQLEQLQDQLVSTMIENQNMADEIKMLKDAKNIKKLRDELEGERRRNKELVKKITQLANTASSSAKSSPDGKAKSKSAEGGKSKGGMEMKSLGKVKLETGDTDDLGSLSDAKPSGWLERLSLFFLDRYYNVIEDFSVTADDIVDDTPTGSLSVKTLRENVLRFKNGIAPVFDCLDGLKTLFMWKNPLLTGVVFIAYMYLCYTGFLIPGILFCILFRLTLNLLQEMQLIRRVTLLPVDEKPDEDADKDDPTLGEKFNIVVQVATNVQNKLGVFANNLEKLDNLLTWKQKELTKKIYTPLCFISFLSLFLSLNHLVMLVSFFLGIKLFVTDPIYNRYPRIRQKYDTVYILWQELMTNYELAHYKALAENTRISQSSSQQEMARNSGSSSSYLAGEDSDAITYSTEDLQFCDRFHLPYDERQSRSTAFRGGRSCIHLEKDQQFKLSSAYSNYAKLYLTPNFLCFEMVKGDIRQSIPLSDITRVEKRKAISILPGTGTAMEISIQGYEKPHIFGGLVHRDSCYDELMERGRALQAPYALTDCSKASGKEHKIRLSELDDSVEELGDRALTTNGEDLVRDVSGF